MNFIELKALVVKGLLTLQPLERKLIIGQSTASAAGAISLRPDPDELYVVQFARASHGEAGQTRAIYWLWNDNGGTETLGNESKATDVRSYLYELINQPIPLICTRNSYLQMYTLATAAQYHYIGALVYRVDGLAKAQLG